MLDPLNNSNKKIDIKLDEYNKSIAQYHRVVKYDKKNNILSLYDTHGKSENLLATYDINTHNRQSKPKRI